MIVERSFTILMVLVVVVSAGGAPLDILHLIMGVREDIVYMNFYRKITLSFVKLVHLVPPIVEGTSYIYQKFNY